MSALELKTGETTQVGKVTVERLPDGYYYFTWEKPGFDCTRLVHPWNVTRELDEINAA